jgi:hypothetical protein
MLVNRWLLVFNGFLTFVLAAHGEPPVLPATNDPVPEIKIAAAVALPVGWWKVEFANGVVERCKIDKDGNASVFEPKRIAGGKATVKEGTVVIISQDDRVERWTPVGQRVVVEHWYRGAQFPSGTPVLGIAEKMQPMSSRDGVIEGDLIPDRLVKSVKKKVGSKGPTLVFKLYATWSFSNFHYRIDVCEKDGRVLQSEEFQNEVSLDDGKNAFQITDTNDDGYRDIKVLGGQKDGKPWYKVWLYQPATKRFVWSKAN